MLTAIAADISQAAGRAGRTSRNTDSPPMMYEPVTQVTALFRRNNLPQLPLHFGRFFYIVYKTDQIDKPYTMGIRDDRRFPEDVTHNKIRAFPADSRKGQKLPEGVRHLIVIFCVKNFHTG